MNIEKRKYKYPTRYEIEQTMGEFAKRKFVDKFAQSRGIFITKANQINLAEHLSGFFYEHNDIEEIRDTAYKSQSTNSLSGFIIHADQEDFDPVTTLKNLREKGDIDEGMNLSPITIENDGGGEFHKGRMDYIKRKPGRIEFLQEEHRSFEFYIQKTGDSEYQFLVSGTQSNDSKVFERFFKKKTKNEMRFKLMDQDLLTSEKTINFFDELATRGMSQDWSLIEVMQLVFRKHKNEDEEEAEDSQLAGITQAILEGKNLRENSFVKQSEERGYRFTAMTYKFENINNPYLIEIKAEFKFRPKVFEVNINNYYQREGLEESEEEAELKSHEEMQIKAEFWREANIIFSELNRIE